MLPIICSKKRNGLNKTSLHFLFNQYCSNVFGSEPCFRKH